MKTLYCLLLATGIAVSLLFVGCTDHQEPQPDRLRLKKLIRSLPDQGGRRIASLLAYRPDGQLDSVFSYQIPDSANAPTQASKYLYNSQGRLSEMTRKLSQGGSERYLYQYDEAGRVASIYYTGADLDYYDFKLEYDAAGNLVSTKRSFRFASAFWFEKTNLYTFSAENLSRMISTTTFFKAVPQTSISTFDYVYDGHPNPFYGIALLASPDGVASPITGNFLIQTYCGGIDNVFHLSKNNPLSSNIKGYSQTLYEYSYNLEGLPERRNTFVKQFLDLPAVLSETLLFEYERY